MIFTAQPEGFNSQVEVVACYLYHHGMFLLLQRQPHKPHGGKWGLPAGKVDPGEDIGTAVRREVYEETGIDLKELPVAYLKPIWVRNNRHEFVYHSFLVEMPFEPTVTLSEREHQAYAWVSPSEAHHIDLIHDLATCNELLFPS